jgi:phosphohistidine phosphatase
MRKKPDYWYKQSAVIPFRILDNRFEVLIVKTRKNKNWIFPKGIIENGYSAKSSAEKEAVEEAGVKGKILPKKIGKYSYKKWGGKCTVKVYGLEVDTILDTYEEDFRERKWIDIDKAADYIFTDKLLEIFHELKNMIHID